jgi:hypothetical protein
LDAAWEYEIADSALSWKAKPDRRTALEGQGSFATQAAFSLML